MNNRAEKIQETAKVLRDAIFSQGKNWLQAAEDVLNAVETEYEYEYEYAVQWTVKGSDVPVPIQEDNWVQRGSAERMIEFNQRMFPDKMQEYTVRLVKRRKAGRVEDV